MPKKKERSNEEFYRGKLREAEKQIRDLQRQVRTLEKTAHIPKKKDVKIPVDLPLTCNECGKGEIQIMTLLDKVYHSCSLCSYRRKVSG